MAGLPAESAVTKKCMCEKSSKAKSSRELWSGRGETLGRMTFKGYQLFSRRHSTTMAMAESASEGLDGEQHRVGESRISQSRICRCVSNDCRRLHEFPFEQ